MLSLWCINCGRLWGGRSWGMEVELREKSYESVFSPLVGFFLLALLLSCWFRKPLWFLPTWLIKCGMSNAKDLRLEAGAINNPPLPLGRGWMSLASVLLRSDILKYLFPGLEMAYFPNTRVLSTIVFSPVDGCFVNSSLRLMHGEQSCVGQYRFPLRLPLFPIINGSWSCNTCLRETPVTILGSPLEKRQLSL